MKMLCDTSVLLRMALGVSSRDALHYLEDEQYELYYSTAGIWEVAIKNMAGKLALDSLSYEQILIHAGFKCMDIRAAHIQQINHLENIHKDPFDRLMIAQAIHEKALFLTTVKILSGYHPSVLCIV